MKRRKPLRRFSIKHQKMVNDYRETRKEYLALNRICEAGVILGAAGIECGCTKWATEIHHSAKRGKNLCNVDTWVPCCNRCHRYVEEHKSKARELGLLVNISDL